MSSEREKMRKNILREWSENKNLSYSAIGKIVKSNRATVRNVIRRFTNEQRISDKPKSGRPQGPVNKVLKKKIARSFKVDPGVSVRDAAKKLGASKSLVQKAKTRIGLKTRKKTKKPKRTKLQFNTAVRRAKKLYGLLCNMGQKCILMDDETYVKMDFNTLPGNQFYTAENDDDISDEEKFILVAKFGKKIMVWQAICSCGKRSRPFFTVATINAEIYMKECLQTRLLPFIRQHNGNVLFWPDLASAHYARSTLNWYESKNIDFVTKDNNPPNCPELRPIERYWALVKAELRKTGETAASEDDFKKSG